MFAEAIKNDRHAKVIMFENVFKFVGYERYDVAVKQLKKLCPGIKAIAESLHSKVEILSGTRGPSKDTYMISVREFETLLWAAKTDDGANAREIMLDLKDAVQDFMKMEMEASSQAANKRLAIEEARRVESDAKRYEMETAQAETALHHWMRKRSVERQ